MNDQQMVAIATALTNIVKELRNIATTVDGIELDVATTPRNK